MVASKACTAALLVSTTASLVTALPWPFSSQQSEQLVEKRQLGGVGSDATGCAALTSSFNFSE